MKMERVKSKSKPSTKLSKRPAVASIKKALATSLSTLKAKRGAKGVQVKADSGLKKRPINGTIYISHLPHGFYEKQIKDYFSQFGTVLGVRLPRSKRTARSRGHAFVRFLNKEVAEVAVQSMNKYLMSNRILEASLLTPQKARYIRFTKDPPITRETCPKTQNRQKFISKRNSPNSELQHEKMVLKEQETIENMQKKLTELGLPKLEL